MYLILKDLGGENSVLLLPGYFILAEANIGNINYNEQKKLMEN
jgi:hypothetical protein